MKSNVENYSTEKNPFVCIYPFHHSVCNPKKAALFKLFSANFSGLLWERLIILQQGELLIVVNVLFLTTRRCFDDGWQSNMSGSRSLTLLIGGNISEPVGMSEQPNYEGAENAKPMLRGVSKDGALPLCPSSPNCHTHLPVLQSAWEAWASQDVLAGREREEGGIVWLWPQALPLALGRRYGCSLTKRNLNWRSWS